MSIFKWEREKQGFILEKNRDHVIMQILVKQSIVASDINTTLEL